MKTFIIGYDLNRPGQKYDDLFAAIKAYGTWCHPLDSTWFVCSNKTAKQIRDSLSKHIDSNDKLIVAELTGQAAWIGFAKNPTEWLKKYL